MHTCLRSEMYKIFYSNLLWSHSEVHFVVLIRTLLDKLSTLSPEDYQYIKKLMVNETKVRTT